MFVLVLFTCIVLRAFNAQAKVVESFDDCKGFFYKDTEPEGMDQNAKKICQKLEYDQYYYATLYSVPRRIPLYSAFTFDPECSGTAGRTENWHIEPQISQPESRTDHMVRERDSDENIIKKYQAISSDYINSRYNHGLLNPNSFQCNKGRIATLTLTNAAPIDESFDRIQWKNSESALRSFLRSKLDSHGGSATVYIVTGTVPDDDVQIPRKGTSEDPERVTVPSYIWTAICYKHHHNDTKSFSFGYIGKNQPGGGISLMRVSDLNEKLSSLYRKLLKTHQSIKIFVGDCFDDSEKLNEVQGVFEKLIKPNQVDEMATDVQNMSRTQKRVVRSPYYSKITVGGSRCTDGDFCSQGGEDYYWCYTDDGIFFYTWDYCSPPGVVGSRAKNGEYCRSNYACSTYGSDYKWCYTQSDNNDMCCTSDNCFSAVNDKTCWSNHPCGYHGQDYLWCYTDDKGNWEYCCKNCY
ncbi:endonuclease domain-containing 1 protein [Carassius auratus]|uniref:Endonuclease domain-containing 1 protein n=1 Tax=Carassius auratus TaxID=7957 RepID=A0A6P6MXJ3_CARAU|nr:endonuclease domain-containing 1 protein-like [Carassius auratus]